jgi:ABC-type branched-subunit amino acid transport system substrate-binding protein
MRDRAAHVKSKAAHVKSNTRRKGEMHMLHRWSRAGRPAALVAAALGLVLGLLGGSAGIAGAAFKSPSTYPAYVGGHGKANPKLSPITIGVVNQQTAPAAPAPAWTTGAKIGVTYVNQHTGGIDGHPLRAVYCTIPTTVGAATRCGQEFADNHAISAVLVGAVDDGNQPLESALAPAKKPTFFAVSLSSVDEHDPYGFILYNTATQVEAPMASVARNLHMKSISLVYPSNIAGNVYQAGVVYAGLKYVGIKTIYKVGVTSAETNLSAPFEAAHVGHTTLLILVNSGGPLCSDTYLTLKSLGVATSQRVLVNVPCDTPTVAKADGGKLPHDWYYLTANPLPGSPTPAVPAMEKVFSLYGKGPVAFNAWAADAFGQVVTVAKLDTELLKAHKKVDSATVFAKARAFKGPVVQGAPHVSCGRFKGTPATCNDLDRFFQNTAPTVMRPLGTWIGPPKGFKPPLS